MTAIDRMRFSSAGRQIALSLSLLSDRRAVMFLVADGALMLFMIFASLAGDEEQFFYTPAVLLPMLLIGLPLLSDCVDLERRAGTLDLALSSGGLRFYFERRIGTATLLLAAQGSLMLLFFRLIPRPYALLPAFVQLFVTAFFLAATVLFWAVRLRTSGSVLFASVLVVFLLSPWFFASPIFSNRSLFTLEAAQVMGWLKANVVLGGAGVILYLYALRRLSVPEKLLQ